MCRISRRCSLTMMLMAMALLTIRNSLLCFVVMALKDLKLSNLRGATPLKAVAKLQFVETKLIHSSLWNSSETRSSLVVLEASLAYKSCSPLWMTMEARAFPYQSFKKLVEILRLVLAMIMYLSYLKSSILTEMVLSISMSSLWPSEENLTISEKL
jgi:hypothetical protein